MHIHLRNIHLQLMAVVQGKQKQGQQKGKQNRAVHVQLKICLTIKRKMMFKRVQRILVKIQCLKCHGWGHCTRD